MNLSAVMIRMQTTFRLLPPGDVAAFSRILFEHFRGVDPEHDRRWRHVWKALLQFGGLTLYPVHERNGAFHRKYFALEARIFDSSEAFPTRAALRWWLKTGAVFGAFVAQNGALVFVPSSLKFEECSDDEMREYVADLKAWLHDDPRARAQLWANQTWRQQGDTLEAVLNPPQDFNPEENP